MTLKQYKTLFSPRDTSYAADAMDGSVIRMNRFLQELVDLTGQIDSAHAVPVLELQLGEVVTITSLLVDSAAPSLLITALLPRQHQSDCLPLPPSSQLGMAAILPDGSEFLWHADEGRYVLVRQVPVGDLQDERSVLDAILDTSDQAASWFASVCIPVREPH